MGFKRENEFKDVEGKQMSRKVNLNLFTLVTVFEVKCSKLFICLSGILQ